MTQSLTPSGTSFCWIRGVKTKKKQVTDIITCTQWFLVYVAIMHQKLPDKVPKMIAYMLQSCGHSLRTLAGGFMITTTDSRQQRRATKTGQSWIPIYTASVSQVGQRRSQRNSFKHVQEDCPHCSPLAIHSRTTDTCA